MKKIKIKLSFIFETIIPLTIIILPSTLLVLIRFKIISSESFISMQENFENLVTSITTMLTVFCAIIITSLSVFGSTNSYSISILAENEKILKKFIFYASSSLLGGAILFIFSLFPMSFFSLYLFIFSVTFASIWAYTVASIAMFYHNMKNIKKQIKDDIFIRGEIRKLTNDVDDIAKLISKIKEDIKKTNRK